MRSAAKRSWLKLSAVLLLLGIGLAALYFEPTPEQKLQLEARKIVKLPDEAQVIRFEPGEWGGGTVEFTLPRTRTIQSWLEFIWSTNLHTGETFRDKYRISARAEYGVEETVIVYDPISRRYSYIVEVEK